MNRSPKSSLSSIIQYSVLSICFALLFCGALPASDQLQLPGGTKIEGTLLSISAEGCVLVDANGRTTLHKDAAITQLGVDGPTPRWARIPAKEVSKALRITGFQNGVLRCTGVEGQAVELRAGKDNAVEFYTTNAPERLLKVPHVKQKPDYCGEACIEMVTTYVGEPISQDRFNELAELKAARGVYGKELVQVIDGKLKMETAGRVGRACRTTADHLWDRVSLVRAISEGRPVLLGFWANPAKKTNEDHWAFDHFVLLVGYNLIKGVFLINDPGDRTGQAREVPFDLFAKHRENKFGGLFHIEFPPWRTWTVGERKVRAQFVRTDDKQAVLRVSNGAESTVELKQLSEEDRKAIARLSEK
jgi:hypothetical protein